MREKTHRWRSPNSRQPASGVAPRLDCAGSGRFSITWSTMPNSFAASAVMKLSRSSACSIVVEVLAGVLHVDLVEPALEALDLAGVDHDVGHLALIAARGLVDHDAGVRQREAHARLAGGQSSSEPIEAAWPTQSVETGQRMNCMVS